MSVYEMILDFMTITLGKMTVSKLSIDKMAIKNVLDKMYVDKMTCRPSINMKNHQTQHQMKEKHTRAMDWKLERIDFKGTFSLFIILSPANKLS
jgi:hypothetical protein